MKKQTHLTPSQAAFLLGVAPVTVRVWANKGWLKADMTAGGHRRFSRQEVIRFARERNLTLRTQQAERMKILIVDDEVDFAAILQEILATLPEPANVEIANDGFEAGLKVLSFEPDIVILDLRMPKIDGFSVCKKIKQDPLTRGIRVIAMTGHPTREVVTRILTLGAEACLSKPIEPSSLLDLLTPEVSTI